MRRLQHVISDSTQVTKRKNKKGKRKKPGVNKRLSRKEKYGVVIPTKYVEAVKLDIANGNTLWQTAVATELAALIEHGCFEFKPKGFKPSKDYQFAPMMLVFEVKQDLRRKARLVIQGFRVNPHDLSTRSTSWKKS